MPPLMPSLKGNTTSTCFKHRIPGEEDQVGIKFLKIIQVLLKMTTILWWINLNIQEFITSKTNYYCKRFFKVC
jgi:hypothetical protein